MTATPTVPVPAEPERDTCDCFEKMGNDYFFMPTGICFRSEGKCNNPPKAKAPGMSTEALLASHQAIRDDWYAKRRGEPVTADLEERAQDAMRHALRITASADEDGHVVFSDSLLKNGSKAIASALQSIRAEAHAAGFDAGEASNLVVAARAINDIVEAEALVRRETIEAAKRVALSYPARQHGALSTDPAEIAAQVAQEIASAIGFALSQPPSSTEGGT